MYVTNACGVDTIVTQVGINCLVGTGKPIAEMIQLWPNPSSGLFYISSAMSETLDYQVISLQGVQLCKGEISGNGNAVIDMREYAVGVYYVRLVVGGEVEVRRIVRE